MREYIEGLVGLFVVLLCLIFVFESVRIVKYKDRYKLDQILFAKFNNIDGVKIGTEVKIGGLKVGSVDDIQIESENFQIKVKIKIREDLKIPSDSLLAVTSSGIFGIKYLTIKAGFDDSMLHNGDFFTMTQSSMNLEDLISKFATSSGK